jgi:hypothetical protein
MARQRASQPRPHLAGKNLVAQPLRLPHFVQMPSPTDRNAAVAPNKALIGWVRAPMKYPPGQLHDGQRLGRAGQFFHGVSVFYG